MAPRFRLPRARAVALIAALTTAAGALAACHSSPPPQPPVDIRAPRIHGPLHTDGTRIVDAKGTTVRFLGVDVGGMGKGDGLPGDEQKSATGCAGWQVPDAATYRNVDAWGFNTVRISLSWANLQPDPPTTSGGAVTDPNWNAQYLSALTTVVHNFTSRGIAVILHISESHWSPRFGNVATNKGTVKCAGVGMPDWLYTSGQTETQARLSFFDNQGHQQAMYGDAWKEVVRRFAGDPLVVEADMLNEPYTKNAFNVARLRLDRVYDVVGTAIRSVDPDILLAFQDSQYSPDGVFALQAPPALKNVVYSFHFYEDNWNAGGEAKVQAYLDRAKAWNVPLWIGEFDAFSYASPRPGDASWLPDLLHLMALCKQNGISWTEFAYADRWMLQPPTDDPKPNLLQTLKTGV